MYIVSACLCGVNCKYNGENNYSEKIDKLLRSGKAILICPEQLGGLTTPRPPAEIVEGTAKDIIDGRGKIKSINGIDVTEEFLKGAKESLKIAEAAGCKKAVLKARSPSCGAGKIYDGSFKGKIKEGNGLTAEIFIKNGIEVMTEEDFQENK